MLPDAAPALIPDAAQVPGVASWHGLPAAQQPDWPDRRRLHEVTAELTGLPPLVFAGECDLLRDRLAAVTRGEAFVLQGGDCAETFAGATAEAVHAKLQTLLQMAVVLTYAASVPIVKIGRMAGQFAKPRSSPAEVREGVALPAYRGDAINGFDFTPADRTPDPARLLRAYHCSAVTLNLCRAFTAGGMRTCARCTPGTRTSSPRARRASAMSGSRARSTALSLSCVPAGQSQKSCVPWSSFPVTRL